MDRASESKVYVHLHTSVECNERQAIRYYLSAGFLEGIIEYTESSCVSSPGTLDLMFSVDRLGLSASACQCRRKRIPLVSSHSLITLISRQAQQQLPNSSLRRDGARWLQGLPNECPLLPLMGYTICMTGFPSSSSTASMDRQCAATSKSVITDTIEDLGGRMQARLDAAVDVLLVPWDDLGDNSPAPDRWTAKVQFAIRSNIPVLSAAQFIKFASLGTMCMSDMFEQLALPRPTDDTAHRGLVERDTSHTTSSSYVDEAATLVIPPVGRPHVGVAQEVISDEDVLALCTPMWVVLFGLTAAETRHARRCVSLLHPIGVVLQPVLTSLATHVVVGKAIETASTVRGNRDALEHFLTRLHRLPLSRLKTTKWLDELCGGREPDTEDAHGSEDLIQCLRAGYDKHPLFADGTDEDKTPQMLLNGFLAPVADVPPPPAPLARPPPATANYSTLHPSTPLGTNQVTPHGEAHVATPKNPSSSSEGNLQPALLLREFADLLHGLWPKLVDDVLHQYSSTLDTNAAMAALMSAIKERGRETLFTDTTFVCLEEDARKARKVAAPADAHASEVEQASTRADEKWLFSLHRKAAVRLLVKGCGGTFVRKTNAEMSAMMEEDHEWFRGGHALTKQRCANPLQYVALMPHAFETSGTVSSSRAKLAASSAKQQGGPSLTSGHSHSLRGQQQKSAAAQRSLMEGLWIPVVTTTWVQAAIASTTLGLPSMEGYTPKVKRWFVRGAPEGDATANSRVTLTAAKQEFHSLRFLRHFSVVSNPYTSLITSATSLVSLERVLPQSPSSFLTTKRYIKHRVVASSGDGSPLLKDVGHGIVIMFVCWHSLSHSLTGADVAAVQQAITALGGSMEAIESSGMETAQDVPLHRVTHIVTNCTTKVALKLDSSDLALNLDGDENEDTDHANAAHPPPFALRAPADLAVSDASVRQQELLRCAVLIAQHRDDVVVVDQSWFRQSISVGYFVEEADYLVGPEVSSSTPHVLPGMSANGINIEVVVGDQHEKPGDDDDDKFDALGDVMTSAVSRLERTIGEGNSSVLGGGETPKPISRKRSRSDGPLPSSTSESLSHKSLITVKAEPRITTTAADGQAREESPTAVHCVQQNTVQPTAPKPRGARIYVLGTVPKLQELREAVATRLSQPAVCLPSNSATASAAAAVGRWSHLEWSSTSAGADIIVTNEVTQRESVLLAMSAGVWLVTDAFIWDSYREHRLCNIESYEWSPSMLKDPKKTTLALATNVAYWRRQRQEQQRGPFGPPCIRSVVVLGATIGATLKTIIEVGDGNVRLIDATEAGSLMRFALKEALEANGVRSTTFDETRSLCACRQECVIVLVEKGASPEYTSQVTLILQTWLAAVRINRIATSSDAQPELTSGADCAYPGHMLDARQRDPSAQSTLRAEIHSFDWVSAVLQRKCPLNTMLFSEEL